MSAAPCGGLLSQVLQPPHAAVYVASKTYYFGVGGGTKTFRKLIKEVGMLGCTMVQHGLRPLAALPLDLTPPYVKGGMKGPELIPHYWVTLVTRLIMAVLYPLSTLSTQNGIFEINKTLPPLSTLSTQDGIFEIKTIASIQDTASGNKREVWNVRMCGT